MEDQTETDLDISRWYTIFGLLSMERVEPFLSHMGVQILDIQSIRIIARQFVEEYFQRTGDIEADRLLMRQTFARIAEVTNEDTAQRLYQWGIRRFPYAGSDGSKEQAWLWILRSLAGLVAGVESNVMPELPENKLQKITQILRKDFHRCGNVLAQIQQAEQLPRSDWEERIYAEYGSIGSPLDAVELAIEQQAFCESWGPIKSLLNSEELEELKQWAKSRARHLGMPVHLVELPICV
jgi:hypothetical protein